MPVGPDGRELPPLQPGAEPPPAVLPAYEYASRNLQSSYAPPLSSGGKHYSRCSPEIMSAMCTMSHGVQKS